MGFKLIILGSIFAIIAAPSTAFVSASYQAGSFQGLASHRNYMGYLLCISALIFAHQVATSTKKRLSHLMWLVASLTLLVLTRSVTSLAMACLWVVVLLIVIRILRNNSRYQLFQGLSLFVTAALIGTLALLNYQEIATGLGRDATLTGRTTIWSTAWHHIALNPLLGEGWSSVWGVGDEVGDSIRGSLGFSISHAHNGYLNDALQIGLVGAGLISLSLIVAISLLMRSMVESKSTHMALGLIILLAIMCFNFVEARLTLNTGWILFTAFYAYASRAQIAQKVQIDRERQLRLAERSLILSGKPSSRRLETAE